MPRLPKMKGGSIAETVCPPGFLCMSNTMLLAIFFGCITVLLVALIFAKQYGFLNPSEPTHTYEAPTKEPTVIVVQSPQTERPQPPTIINSDPRFSPLPPEQTYNIPPDLRTGNPLPAGIGPVVPVNIQTRGYSDTFQQIGLLTTPGGTDNSASPTRTVLPLFGRKLTTNRDRWNYYTRTDGMNPVQVPVQYKRRNCDEDIGCDEVMDGDSVGVPVLGQSYIASMYRYSTPRYIPFA